MNIETIKRYEHYRKNWRSYIKEIKAALFNYCPDVDVYVFGSIIKGGTHPTSDIDVLIVSEEFKDIRKRIEIHSNLKLLFLDAPFELHLIYPDKLPFYRKMAKEMVKI